MFSFGGLIAGGIEGAGKAVGDVAQGQIDTNNKAWLAQQFADIEVQKQQRIDENRMALDNQQRVNQVQRIATAKLGLIGAAIDAKYPNAATSGLINSGDDSGPSGTGTSFSDIQHEATNSAVAADRAALDQDPNTTIQAAISTGDISPKDVASLTSKTDVAQIRAQALLDRNNALREIGEARNDAARAIAQAKLDAAQARIDGLTGQLGEAKMNAGFARAQIASLDTDIKAHTSMINSLSTVMLGAHRTPGPNGEPSDYDQVKAEIQEHKDAIIAAMKDKAEMMKNFGPSNGAGAFRPTRSPSGGAAPSTAGKTSWAPVGPGGSRADVAEALATWQAQGAARPTE